MNEKKWLVVLVSASFIMVLFIGGVNYAVDPLWIFQHKNRFNTCQLDFNERLQKSVQLKFNKEKKFDTLLLGSSRSTFYNQEHFFNMKTYNYSFSGAMPSEYFDYIEFAKENNSRDFKKIIIGLDFFGYQKTSKQNKESESTEILAIDNKLMFFIKHYFSIKMFKYSIFNIKNSLTNNIKSRRYNRNNIALIERKDEKHVELVANSRSKNYYKDFTHINPDYEEIFLKIKINNKESSLIAYTTPLSEPYLQEIYKDEYLFQYYILWIKEMVSIFKKVYFFTGENSFSQNYKNYSFDGDHFYPNITDKIIQILTKNEKVDEYGIVLTKENLDEYVESLKNKKEGE